VASERNREKGPLNSGGGHATLALVSGAGVADTWRVDRARNILGGQSSARTIEHRRDLTTRGGAVPANGANWSNSDAVCIPASSRHAELYRRRSMPARD